MLSLRQRLNFVERADAVRRLQQIGENRRARIFQGSMLNEIDRLRGDLRYSTPAVTQQMKGDINRYVENLKALKTPDDGGTGTSLRPIRNKQKKKQ